MFLRRKKMVFFIFSWVVRSTERLWTSIHRSCVCFYLKMFCCFCFWVCFFSSIFYKESFIRVFGIYPCLRNQEIQTFQAFFTPNSLFIWCIIMHKKIMHMFLHIVMHILIHMVMHMVMHNAHGYANVMHMVIYMMGGGRQTLCSVCTPHLRSK